MVAVYGGLWFENLVRMDEHYTLQCRLFERGIIDGIQMRVVHPSYTPDVTAEELPKIAARLPRAMPVFIHFGAENCGVDFGETLDECAVYAERGKAAGKTWADWNAESVAWGKRVAEVLHRVSELPIGVVHAGYGTAERLGLDFSRAAAALRALGRNEEIAIENVPPVVKRSWYEALAGTHASGMQDEFIGFGGLPVPMRAFLAELGDNWKCLIDFTHLLVAWNQMVWKGKMTDPVAKMIAEFMGTPHWPICHFSGTPPTLMDSSDHMDAPVCEPIRDAIRTMDVVCLEIPFRQWSAERIIEDFRERYLESPRVM